MHCWFPVAGHCRFSKASKATFTHCHLVERSLSGEHKTAVTCPTRTFFVGEGEGEACMRGLHVAPSCLPSHCFASDMGRALSLCGGHARLMGPTFSQRLFGTSCECVACAVVVSSLTLHEGSCNREAIMQRKHSFGLRLCAKSSCYRAARLMFCVQSEHVYTMLFHIHCWSRGFAIPVINRCARRAQVPAPIKCVSHVPRMQERSMVLAGCLWRY